MSSDLKKEYTRLMWLRYQNASKRQKTIILNEFCELRKVSRKYAIRLMGKVPTHFKKNPGAKAKYSRHAIYHLRKLWIRMNQINSKRLKNLLPLWITNYVASKEVKEEILKMSAATMERAIAPIRAKTMRRIRSGTRPGRLKHVIPIKPFNHNINQPGHLEADTVAHCGNSLTGEFIWTVTVTDIYSGWTECRAIWGKGSNGVLEALKDIEESLPFPILSFNSDNGSEFLNHTIYRYFSPDGEKKRPGFLMTRSREYRKNDNCHVEQKNGTHVRELFGYERFNDSGKLSIMNNIYKDEQSLLQNYFFNQMKLKSKVRVGSRYRRNYDTPLTPHQRIMNCGLVPEETKKALTERIRPLNPFALQKQLQQKLKLFFKKSEPFAELKEAA